MSILTNNINITTSTSLTPLPIGFTVGSVVDVSSGYPEPILIQSVDDLMKYFDSSKDLTSYAFLLNQGISLYLLPTLVRGYDHNRASIRLINDTTLCAIGNPRYNTDSITYQPVNRLSFLDLLKIDLGENTFVYELDFSNITDISELINKWIIIKLQETGIPTNPVDSVTGYRLGIRFESPSMEINPISINYPHPSSYDNDDLIRIHITDSSTVNSVLSDIKTIINTTYESRAFTPAELIYKICNKFTDPVLGLDLDSAVDECTKLDFGSVPMKTILNHIEEYQTGVELNNTSDFYLIIYTGGTGSIDYLPNIESDGMVSYSWNTNSTIQARNSSMNYDILDWHTRGLRGVDFYSKLIGDPGRCTITITNAHDLVYNIKITSQIETEEFLVNCGEGYIDDTIKLSDINTKSKLIFTRIYDIIEDNIPIDSSEARFNNLDLDYSTLITEFKLPEGTYNLDRCKSEPVDWTDYNNSLEIFRTSGAYPDVFLVPDLPSVNCIDNLIHLVKSYHNGVPVGSDESIFSQVLINLSARMLIQSTRFNSIENRLLYFYGDAKLRSRRIPLATLYVNRLNSGDFFGKEDYPVNYTELDFKLDSSIIVKDQSTLSSRTLTSISVEDDCEYIVSSQDGNSVYSVIKGDQIYDFNTRSEFENSNQLPQDFDTNSKSIISVKSLLDEKFINYLKYDDTSYYYDFIKEFPNQGSVFIIRLIESLYTRTVYTRLIPMTGSKLKDYESELASINKDCSDRFDFVSSTESHELSPNGSILSIKFEITVEKLINKKFDINIIINI